MRISFSLLLSAFLATVKGQTFTFDFPPTGTGIGGPDAHQVCVEGAKWADLITTNDQSEESRYDISSTDFRNGDKMDANWAGRYAVNIPEDFECKGGILFQHDKLKPHTSHDLTLKATLADGETKLTVCAFYTFFYQHSPSPNWSDTLPALGFTKSLRLFQKATSGDYKQYYNPETVPYFNQINTLCRSFDSVIDSEYFDEAEPLPATVSYTFPEVGDTRILSGICIKGAQFASATNSVADYPELRMSTRKFERIDNIWWDNFWFETNRNTGYGMPMADYAWSARTAAWTAGNPCEGALYLQPQHLDIVGFYYEEPRFTTHSRITTEADMERFRKNLYTVDIMPVANESSVQICALISRSYWYTSSWLNVLGDYGFTTNGPDKDINGFEIFCKDVDANPNTLVTDANPNTLVTDANPNTRVTMKLHL